MHRSQLHLYLLKVAQGDSSFVSKLCHQLADRLVYSPVLRNRDSSKGTVTKVSAVIVREGDRTLVPMFTALPLLKKWCEMSDIEAESISLLCADLCGALAKDCWLLIDPGTEHAVELEPSAAREIASVGGEDTPVAPTSQSQRPRWSPPEHVPTEQMKPPPGYGVAPQDLTSPVGGSGVAKEVSFKGFLLGGDSKQGLPSQASPASRRVRSEDDNPRDTRDLTSVKEE